MLFLREHILAHNLGVAASGSPEVSQTAVEILEAGGNAFDAALGALCAAVIAEPLLASLGGGGFLLAMPGSGSPLVYDFFCQTPAQRRIAGARVIYQGCCLARRQSRRYVLFPARGHVLLSNQLITTNIPSKLVTIG